MSELIIDLSHHNTIPESLAPAREFGVKGVIHKITEGSSYVDDKAKARWSLVRDAGMLWGGYHFLNEKSSGATQANFFYNTMRDMGIIDNATLLAADHEDSDVALAQLKDFLVTLKRLSGRDPVVYSGHVLKEQLASYVGPNIPVRLWLAQYGDKATLPKGFSEYWLWQYTDQGEVPGIDGNVDLNRFSGSGDQLAYTWAGYKGAAPTVPDEKVVNVVVDIETPPGVRVNVTIVNPGPD